MAALLINMCTGLGVEPGNEVPDGHQIGDVEGRRLHSRIPGGFGYLIRDLAPCVEPATLR